MLLKFRVANYRSIRDRQELSFVATRLNQRTAVDLPMRPSSEERVLPVIAVYGANASGKSNLLRALGDLVPMLVGERPVVSARPRFDPFRLDTESPARPSSIELEFVVQQVKYEYAVSFDADHVVSEWLHAFPRGRRQVWFERMGEEPESFRFPGGYLGGAIDQLAEIVRRDLPFLALGNVVNHPQLSPVGAWMRRISLADSHRIWPWSPAERLATQWTEQLNELVDRADIGVSGAEIVEVSQVVRPGGPAGAGVEERSRPRRELRLVHRTSGGDIALPLDAESDGTISWLLMLGPVLRTLNDGGVYVVDELNASLHPTLAAEIIRMFHDPKLNRRHAQLLFSSHDATVLGTTFGSPLLDRDQIWFTEKNREGATEVYGLAELSPRVGENLEFGYLAGRYGAAPDLSPGELSRALKESLERYNG